MAKVKTKIDKATMHTIIRGARRAVDIEAGIGLNMRHNVFTDKRKKANKNHCRDKHNGR